MNTRKAVEVTLLPDRRLVTVVIPRGGRHRITVDTDGVHWLTVRTWWGRLVGRRPIDPTTPQSLQPQPGIDAASN